MAVKVGELYGTLELDKKPFDKGLDAAEGKSKGWASRIAGTLGSAAGALIKFGAAGAAVAGGGAFVLGNMASDLNETISKTKVVFGDNAKEVLKWGDSAATSLGLSKNAALGARATLGNLFVSMGVGSTATKNMSGDMVELAGDLASFNNMDPTEVLEKLRAGLVGEAEPLRSLGVNITAAATEAKALELGLGGVDRELTAAEKATANYAIIMDQTKTAQGDFARTSEGMANQQRITAATFQDTMAGIGQAVVPLFEALLPQLTTALQGFGVWVTDNMPTIKEVASNVFGGIGTVLTFLFTDVIPILVAAFQAAWPIIVEAMNLVGKAIDWISKHIIPTLMQVMEGVVAWVSSNWPTISRIIGNVFSIVATVIKTVWPIIEAVAKVLFPLVGKAASILVGAIDVAFAVFETIVGAWSNFVRPVFKAVGGVVESFGKAFGKVFDGIAKVAGEVWGTVEGAVKGGINTVIGLVNGLIGFLNGIRIGIPSISIPGTDVQLGGGYFDPFSIPTIPKLAAGARGFPGGWAMVGERGPELAYLPRGSDVYSARESRGMLGSMEVTLRDPDGAIARGGYSQRDLERAVSEAVRGIVGQARHNGARI